MKPEKAFGPDNRNAPEQKKKPRAARRQEQGPIGFNQVFGMVRREKRGARGRFGATDGEGGALLDASQRHGTAIPQQQQPPAAATMHTAAALDSQAVYGTNTADADTAAMAAGAGLDASGASESRSAMQLTPQQAMHAVVDEARRMRLIRDATRELRIELEPANLGPIVVRIMVGDGRIRTEIHAREQRTANLLATGRDSLRDRLAELGYSQAEVVVDVDPAP